MALPGTPIPDAPSPVYFVPLWAWNRLESRPRQNDLSQNLKAPVHDPLWMLARQWQLGEFNHDDTGTGIFAKLDVTTSQISSFKSNIGNLEAFDLNIPMEVKVERESITFSIRDSVVLGEQLIKILNDCGAGFIGLPVYNPSFYKSILLNYFSFASPMQEYDALSNDRDILQTAQLYSNPKAMRLMRLVAGRKIDGAKIFNEVTADLNPLDLSTIDNSIPPSHAPVIAQATQNFIQWVRNVYSIPEGAISNWDAAALNYKFACAAPKTISNTGNTYTVLNANDYSQGSLDWYSFNLGNDSSSISAGLTSPVSGANDNVINESVISLIPSQSRFAGMPATRWWEFEDGTVNFSKIDASTTDIAKILLAQFSLVYQDDWFLVPYKMQIGSIAEVKGIIVKDVFGINTMVMSADSYEYDSQGIPQPLTYDEWNKWNLYGISPGIPDYGNVSDDGGVTRLPAFTPGRVDKRMFFPPSLYKTLSGETLESVLFLRDEVATMAWAIEQNVTDDAGYTWDGRELARNFTTYLENLKPYTPPAPVDGAPTISYNLGNTVPENWIPFLPVHEANSDRNIKLQRASMPRVVPNYSISPVRPRTSILDIGIDSSAINSALNSSYYVNEEAVPQSGAIVEKAFQRVRWLNGKTFVWTGRRKTAGRGEGASGLKFDQIVTTQNQQS